MCFWRSWEDSLCEAALDYYLRQGLSGSTSSILDKDDAPVLHEASSAAVLHSAVGRPGGHWASTEQRESPGESLR